jgi:RNA polymerase sigma-70 factor (ECF subfamily)
MRSQLYARLCAVARRECGDAASAEDVVQDALVVAVASGRSDLADPATARWLSGVVRNKARMLARGAGRRRRREHLWFSEREPDPAGMDPDDLETALVDLPPSLKVLAALALTGHSKREIAYLLDLPDTALRQRLTSLRRALAARGIAMPATTPGLNLDLQYGRIRDALLPLLLAQNGTIASHDPDGHLFVVRKAHKGVTGGN